MSWCSVAPGLRFKLHGREQFRLFEALSAITAQAIRAILLASATAATLIGRRSMIRVSQSRFVPCCRAYRMTAVAPATSSHRKYRLPCFEMPPSRSLPLATDDGGLRVRKSKTSVDTLRGYVRDAEMFRDYAGSVAVVAPRQGAIR